MKRAVKVEVTSTQTLDGEHASFRSKGRGFFNKETGLLSFVEELEDRNQVLTTVRIMEDAILVKKSGGIVSEMPFSSGNRTGGIYRTPYGEYELEIDTVEARHESKGKYERINLKYSLKMEGQLVGYTEMYITAEY